MALQRTDNNPKFRALPASKTEGFGVTVMEGMGKEGSREVLMVSLPRKSVPQVMEIIKQHDESAFVTIMDTKGTRGGYFTQTRKAK